MDVHQVSFFAFWAALHGLEENFDLHLSFLLICCCPVTPEAWLQGHKQAESTAYQPPHLDAAVHSWHNERLDGGGGGGGGRGEALMLQLLLLTQWGFSSLRLDCQGRTILPQQRANVPRRGAHDAELIVCVKWWTDHQATYWKLQAASPPACYPDRQYGGKPNSYFLFLDLKYLNINWISKFDSFVSKPQWIAAVWKIIRTIWNKRDCFIIHISASSSTVLKGGAGGGGQGGRRTQIWK